MITWTGFENIYGRRHSIDLPEAVANDLFKRLKKYKGSTKEFYFKFVNPSKLLEYLKPQNKGNKRFGPGRLQ